MSRELLAFVSNVGETFMKGVPISLALAARLHGADLVLGLQSRPTVVAQARSRHRLCYWFFIPVIARFLRIGMLIAGAAVLFGITTADGLIAFYENGHGPLAALPLAAQMIVVPGRRRFHSVLDAPLFPRQADVEVPRRASLLRRAGVDLGGAVSSGQSVLRPRVRRRRFAARRHLAERVRRARASSPSPIRPSCTPISTGRSARSNT